jgi:hypothetical protein
VSFSPHCFGVPGGFRAGIRGCTLIDRFVVSVVSRALQRRAAPSLSGRSWLGLCPERTQPIVAMSAAGVTVSGTDLDAHYSWLSVCASRWALLSPGGVALSLPAPDAQTDNGAGED